MKFKRNKSLYKYTEIIKIITIRYVQLACYVLIKRTNYNEVKTTNFNLKKKKKRVSIFLETTVSSSFHCLERLKNKKIFTLSKTPSKRTHTQSYYVVCADGFRTPRVNINSVVSKDRVSLRDRAEILTLSHAAVVSAVPKRCARVAGEFRNESRTRRRKGTERAGETNAEKKRVFGPNLSGNTTSVLWRKNKRSWRIFRRPTRSLADASRASYVLQRTYFVFNLFYFFIFRTYTHDRAVRRRVFRSRENPAAVHVFPPFPPRL